MTRALGKGTFHPGKESWVSGAFPTPLPVLGRVGEHGKGPDLCLRLAISTHTHTQVRGWIMESPKFGSFPLPCPAVTPIPRDERWPSAAHTCLCCCLCLGSGAVGAKQGLLQTTRREKPAGFWVWNSSLLQVPALLSIQQIQLPVPLDPSVGTAGSEQRDAKGAGTMGQDTRKGRCHPERAGRAVYCFLHRPLPRGEAKTSSPRGNEPGSPRRRAARSALPAGSTDSRAHLCPAAPPDHHPTLLGLHEGAPRP